MQNTYDTRWTRLALALFVGAAAAAVIWLVGAPERSWLGFVAVALALAGGSAGCRPRLRRKPESPEPR